MKQPNRSEIKAKAKTIVKEKYADILKPILIIYIANIITTLFSENAGYFGLLIELFIAMLNIGVVFYIIKLIRNEEYEIMDVLNFVKNNFVVCLLIVLLTTIFVILWSFLFIIPGIIAFLAYSMVSYIIVDNKEMKAKEVIKASKEIMNGHKANYFVFLLSFTGWILLTIITFGLAYFYFGPYFQVAEALYYEEIKKKEVE